MAEEYAIQTKYGSRTVKILYRKDVTQKQWKSAAASIIEKSNEYCTGGLVQTSYVSDAIKEADSLVLLGEESVRRSRGRELKMHVLVGFAILKWLKDQMEGEITEGLEIDPEDLGPTMYIDVICSKQGNGGLLMEELLRLARRRHQRYIKLSALSDVLRFYPRYGFKSSLNPCEHDHKKWISPIESPRPNIHGWVYTKCLANDPKGNKIAEENVPLSYYSPFIRNEVSQSRSQRLDEEAMRVVSATKRRRTSQRTRRQVQKD
jgi:GNAT superfamily N-acetyltransferase